MRADLRVCDSMLHVSTTKGLRDRYPFGGVNDAALAKAEGVTAPTTRPAPSGSLPHLMLPSPRTSNDSDKIPKEELRNVCAVAKWFFRQGVEFGKIIMNGQLGMVAGTIGRVLDLVVEVRVVQNNA
ncbi:hypothetical protein FOXG_15037 [Fusarium oxysporum f. sp. lycopersici 4287]|uniref:Uncharacterized protein n=1 Tax=Fusarium oxysporum f. sp. lycopersici (strain 4287 / CBS 123668 / FGSC 9935 / NRRL 34936) TaxID=426428 RepID=A0A0J9W0R4_FUSO4|nr:hypothetical protein FOXG_14444 [Fusarium oxysporum f. sp. lycopersici 4287]XP_018255574.1 hypothetical protein FOXG_15037 [Fusarium oxysporum f. sp. lycopersici 4287]KNB16623.1 hypothetical protein FOXG_14444 [Fusarium oxysporum f. sp. lycopersici 4287]KNB17529.1 hypothetical protein FOXG_15037 [Fusarium oxysporum f. sp. lycopersici 4287]